MVNLSRYAPLRKKYVKDVDWRIGCIIILSIVRWTKQVGGLLIGTAISHEYS
jgi:hypothetical protein